MPLHIYNLSITPFAGIQECFLMYFVIVGMGKLYFWKPLIQLCPSNATLVPGVWFETSNSATFFKLLGVNTGLLKPQRRSMCLSVTFARSGHVGPYMLPQTSNQILEFGGLGVWMLCSQCSGLCSLLSIQPVCCSAACGLSVLHTECCTSQRAQRYADAAPCYICMYSSKNKPFNYISCRCSSLGQKVTLFAGDACQKWDLTDYLVAATLSFLQGSEHSSSIHYPISLHCWDKVSFVCLRLLAWAHRALKLHLNDGVFISIPPFRAHSHPSVLSHWTEPHPWALLIHPPTFLLSLSNNSSRTLLHCAFATCLGLILVAQFSSSIYKLNIMWV